MQHIFPNYTTGDVSMVILHPRSFSLIYAMLCVTLIVLLHSFFAEMHECIATSDSKTCTYRRRPSYGTFLSIIGKRY